MKPVALVTGAGTGLGAALAKSLANEGFALALHYRTSKAGALKTQASIIESGGIAETYQANLARDNEAMGLAHAVASHFGRLDLLVNNAGVYQERKSIDLSEAEWFDGLNSTVSQTFFTTRAMLPLLRAGRLKRVVNIGDSSCDRPGARDLALSYHIGKTGVWMLTRTLAAELANDGIAVNMVSPGYLDNSLGLPGPDEIPAGRLGTFQDIYQAIRFLGLESPDYLTGSSLVLSGGWNLR